MRRWGPATGIRHAQVDQAKVRHACGVGEPARRLAGPRTPTEVPRTGTRSSSPTNRVVPRQGTAPHRDSPAEGYAELPRRALWSSQTCLGSFAPNVFRMPRRSRQCNKPEGKPLSDLPSAAFALATPQRGRLPWCGTLEASGVRLELCAFHAQRTDLGRAKAVLCLRTGLA